MIAVIDAPGAREHALIHLTQQIREEFEDALGLRLTVAEAARFWALDEDTCAAVLARLAHAGFIALADDGRYEQVQGENSARREGANFQG